MFPGLTFNSNIGLTSLDKNYFNRQIMQGLGGTHNMGFTLTSNPHSGEITININKSTQNRLNKIADDITDQNFGSGIRSIFTTYAIILMVLGIVDLIYSFKPGCNGDDLLKPTTWMFVHGITNIVVAGLVILFIIIYYITKKITIISVIMYILKIVVLFNTAWVIIGGIILWRDNLHCEPKDFHDWFWASVIIKLIFTTGELVFHVPLKKIEL